MEYRFGAYTLRMATEADRDLLAGWIAADPFHRGKIEPDFFLKEEPGVGCYILLDGDGPLFFFRTENSVRVHIQFGGASAEDRARNRNAMNDGMDWLSLQLAAKSIFEMTFDSGNPLLRSMARRRMRFVEAPEDLRRSLTAERAYIARRKSERNAQQEGK